jgi:purine-nucleoside/S-methyl-5'-thioadenosine phosphorylase / adenosine deaminase
VSGSVLQLPAGPYTAHVVATRATDGDLALSASPDALAAHRRAIVDLPWTWMRQVHGATVVRVERPGDGAGSEADAAATAVPAAALAVQVADCAPVALVGSGGSVGIAHVGWRGLAGGVLPATIASMRTLTGDDAITAVIGPCIHPECYEFGEDDLDVVADVAGVRVRARTAHGTPALDLVAGIEAVLQKDGVTVAFSPWSHCTACTPGYWSHRARGDRERQAMVVWMSAP